MECWETVDLQDSMPVNAVPAGHDTDGDPIYVGRASHNGELLPAKVIPNKQSAYVSASGLEHHKQDAEVLTQYPQQYVWVGSSDGAVPPHAVSTGQTVDGESLYVGRGHWAGSLSVGKVHPSHGCLYLPYGGSEHRLPNYEVLVQQEMWMPATATHSLLVPGTVHAGRDIDGADIYVGRAHHEEAGGLLPAKVIPSRGCAYVSYAGREHMKDQYELLVGNGFGWEGAAGGTVPEKAVPGGTTADGEILYIGRANWGGSLMPGKVQPSQGCLYLPFGGQEIQVQCYEVLVRL